MRFNTYHRWLYIHYPPHPFNHPRRKLIYKNYNLVHTSIYYNRYVFSLPPPLRYAITISQWRFCCLYAIRWTRSIQIREYLNALTRHLKLYIIVSCTMHSDIMWSNTMEWWPERIRGNLLCAWTGKIFRKYPSRNISVMFFVLQYCV